MPDTARDLFLPVLRAAQQQLLEILHEVAQKERWADVDRGLAALDHVRRALRALDGQQPPATRRDLEDFAEAQRDPIEVNDPQQDGGPNTIGGHPIAGDRTPGGLIRLSLPTPNERIDVAESQRDPLDVNDPHQDGDPST